MLLLITQAVLCLIFTIFLYFRYAAKNLKSYVTILVIWVWYLTFVTAVLVPFDIYYNRINVITEGKDEGTVRFLFVLEIIYSVIYWLIYVLSWVIIPIAQEYERAADFTSKDRLKRAIKTNVIFYVILLVIGLIFLLYLIIKQQLTGRKLLAFLIALSNAWGIFLIIFLLGYGLVALPKHIIQKSDYERRIKYLEFCAGDVKETIENRNGDLFACAQEIKTCRPILESNPNRGFIEKIWLDLQIINITQDTIVEQELQMHNKNYSYEQLVDLNQKIKMNKHDIIRLKFELQKIYEEWIHLQVMLGKLPDSSEEVDNFFSRTRKFYFLYMRPILFKLVAFFIILMSLAIILSEITLFTNLPLSLFGLLIKESDNIYTINFISLVTLTFMFCTSLYGLFNLKLSGIYSINDHRHTDSISLLFLASFMCRIGFPLCLNFVQILKLTGLTTQLEIIMGETPDFGKHFIIFFPAILIVLCLFNLFDIYGRLMNILGFHSFGFQNPLTEDKIEEGNETLTKMRLSLEREHKNYDDYYEVDSYKNLKSDTNTKLLVNRHKK